MSSFSSFLTYQIYSHNQVVLLVLETLLALLAALHLYLGGRLLHLGLLGRGLGDLLVVVLGWGSSLLCGDTFPRLALGYCVYGATLAAGLWRRGCVSACA